MANTIKYVFPAGKIDDISLTENYVNDGDIDLNGVLADGITSQVRFLDFGYSRSVSVTTDDDVDVTVYGYQNNVPITEIINAVGGNTTYGDQIFDIVYKINISGAADNLSIGTGTKGFFPLITLPSHVINDYTLTLGMSANPIETAVYATILDDLQSFTYLEWVEDWNVFVLKNLNADSQYAFSSNNTWNFLLVYLEGDDTTINETATLNFLCHSNR